VTPPEPRLQLICRATVDVAPPQVIGSTPAGMRRVVQIRHGRFQGRINGEVLPGGADYQIVNSDGTTYLDARYMIQTDDGAVILVRNHGIRHGVVGDDPSKYYFRSTPRFETGDERYLWLNKLIAICSGARTPDAVFLDFYEVL
jgi:Protein of unknown function (DUF3237)